MRHSEITRGLTTLALLLASVVCGAQSPKALKKLAESSMLVTGSIVIESDGRAAGVSIDKPEALPKEIVGFVTQSAEQWAFKPVVQDGKVVRARAPMTLRIVAKQVEGNKYDVEIRSASFGQDAPAASGERLEIKEMAPPKFPMNAAMLGVSGTVYLVLEVDGSGNVIQLAPERTNLGVAGTDNDMRKFRGMLERSAVAAAKKWTFATPTSGDAAKAGPWWVRVAVAFHLAESRQEANQPYEPKYGQWETYIPGPRNPMPWDSDVQQPTAGGSMDALVDGQLQQLGVGPQLLTPLGAG